MELQEKVVVITGSSSGIGRATAMAFGKCGAFVVVNSRQNVTGGQKVVSEIEHSGGRAIYIQADLSDPDDVKCLFEQARDHYGSIDILINNAGSSKATPFLECKKTDWLKAFDDNFFTTVLCSQVATRIMLEEGGGKILNTASIRGHSHTGREGIIAYSAAKAAVINFTRTLAKELAPKISVNAVSPGFVETPPIHGLPEEVQENFVESTLIKRFIKPDEIARAFVFLAESDAVTGTILLVDGGFTLKIA